MLYARLDRLLNRLQTSASTSVATVLRKMFWTSFKTGCGEASSILCSSADTINQAGRYGLFQR
jgi:hypothetical protein